MNYNGGSTKHVQAEDKRLNITLSIESILLEEYKYASNTAYQAIEDRARVINTYYILLGILTTGLIALYQFGSSSHPNSQLFILLLFFITSLLSFTFFINVIRLRQAFQESIVSMNIIKEYYIQQFQQQLPYIGQTFRWRLKTIPAGERIGSVTFVMSFLIAITGSFSLAGVIALAIKILLDSPNLFNTYSVLVSLIIFLLSLSSYILYYRHSLSSNSEGAKHLKHVKNIVGNNFIK